MTDWLSFDDLIRGVGSTAQLKNARAGLPDLPDGLYVKQSRLRRKAANRLLAHAGMVRPARRFRIAPTLGPRR